MRTTAAGVRSRGDLQVWSPDVEWTWPWLSVLVTTRHGGTSRPPFASLNLGLSSGDEPRRVRRNRECLQEILGLESRRFHTLQQVHGDAVLQASPGARHRVGDGLWTDEPGLVLVVGIADCVPVFLWDTRRGRIALVHAGWRGTAAGILGRAIETLSGAGSLPADLWVAMGPSIGPCCYEVSREVAARFPAAALETHSGSARLDLRAANRLQALASGVPAAQILADPPCTACHTDVFYSYRKEGGRTGRMWALAWKHA